jgi:hypothetical protein
VVKGVFFSLQTYQTFDRSRQLVETPDATIPIPSPRISFGNGGNIHGLDGFDKYPKYPLEMLRGEKDPPSSVDPRRKEVITDVISDHVLFVWL